MTGVLIAGAIALLTLVGLYAAVRGPVGQMAAPAAAILVGLAGYAWQGSASLPGHPVDAASRPNGFDERLVEKRKALSDRLGPANSWITLSDGLARQGNAEDAANVLVSGLRQYPKEAPLWTALGNALVLHGQGRISPAADYAFREAERLSDKGAIGPRYFHGLATAQSGQLDEARKLWLGLARDLPDGHPMQIELVRNLMMIDAIENRQKGADGATSQQPAAETQPAQ